MGAKGRGFTAGCEEGCVERLCRKVLRFDRPLGRRVLKFDGPFGPEGCGIALRAISIYSAKGGRIVSLTLRNTVF